MKTYDDYKQFVRKLAKRGIHILGSLTPQKCEMWHMASAWVGELPELISSFYDSDPKNTFEEFGDCEFYEADLINILNLDIVSTESTGPLAPFDFRKELDLYVEKVGDIFDIIKKNVIYEKELDVNRLKVLIVGARIARFNIYAALGITQDQVIRRNCEKLAKRYPSFSYKNEDAIERKDKKD